MTLEFRHVTYRYPDQPAPAIRDLSFRIAPGEFVGMLGANESGKTTLAKLCNGLLLPTEGEVLVNGRVPGRDIAVHQARRMIGVVFADPEHQIVGSTVEEDVAFGLGNLGVPPAEMRQRIDAALARVGLQSHAQREPHRLSGGEQQKLCLASVLAMQPACLVLDAPLTFLDSGSRQDMLAIVRQVHADGCSLVYLSTDSDELFDADRLLFLHKGRIAGESLSQDPAQNVPRMLHAGLLPSPRQLLQNDHASSQKEPGQCDQ